MMYLFAPENGVRDVWFVILLGPGLVSRAGDHAAVPNPEQQPMPSTYERLGIENVDVGRTS
jgi:hypothetical protein